MSEVKISWMEMVILLNSAMEGQRSNVVVYSDILDLPLFTFDINKGMVLGIANKQTIDRAVDDLSSGIPEGLVKELPNHGDLVDAFRNSLVVLPDKFDELRTKLLEISHNNTKKKGFQKQSCLAIDSNVAYRRLISRLLMHSEHLGIGRSDLLQTTVVIPNMVKRELVTDFPKFNENDIRSMSSNLSPKYRRDALWRWNRCGMKKARKAKNALSELGAIRSNNFNYLEYGSGEFSKDNEERDLEILKELCDFQKNHLKAVVLLSEDKDMETRSECFQVDGFTVNFPGLSSNSYSINPWAMCDLVYQAGIMFGPLSLKGLGVRALSDWTGKNSDDYRDERMLIETDDGSKVATAFLDDLMMSRELLECVAKGNSYQ